MIHTLLGRWFIEAGELSLAEIHLKTALYISPHFLESRMDLIYLYHNKGDFQSAAYWAQQLIDYPIKVPNPLAIEMKEKAKHFCLTFQSKLQIPQLRPHHNFFHTCLRT